MPRALESVTAQQFREWELVIVDDGSTDNTKEVVRTYLGDNRITYQWQKNRELNGARNTGITLANGQYLIFLDDDDLLLPEHLKTLHVAIAASDFQSPVLRTSMVVEMPNQRIISNFEDLQEYHPVQQMWLKPTNLLSFAFHRTVFDKHRFAEEFVLGDDFHFLIKVLLDFPLEQLSPATVVYHQHPQTRTLNYFSKEKAANKFAAMEALWIERGQDLSLLIPDRWRQSWRGEQYLHFARLAFRAGQFGLGWRYFGKSLIYLFAVNPVKFLKTSAIGLLMPFKPLS